MKGIILKCLDGVAHHDPKYKIPVMLILAILLTITMASDVSTNIRYMAGITTILITSIVGAIVKI
ncbi:hypothetical protein C0583_05280 [Candidatus Parcubacteria bacterium]|nr:MAG: hypothetical protein C0583_05280 [Candidatus Parcubacteria bacterium]